MKYYSLNNKTKTISFQEAVIQGLAPDNGLYFPETITPLSTSFFDEIENFLLENCEPGDLLITMGAGDIVKLGENLLGI